MDSHGLMVSFFILLQHVATEYNGCLYHLLIVELDIKSYVYIYVYNEQDDQKSWNPGDCLSVHPSVRASDHLSKD